MRRDIVGKAVRGRYRGIDDVTEGDEVVTRIAAVFLQLFHRPAHTDKLIDDRVLEITEDTASVRLLEQQRLEAAAVTRGVDRFMFRKFMPGAWIYISHCSYYQLRLSWGSGTSLVAGFSGCRHGAEGYNLACCRPATAAVRAAGGNGEHRASAA